MKKIIIAFFVLTISLMLVACGNTQAEAPAIPKTEKIEQGVAAAEIEEEQTEEQTEETEEETEEPQKEKRNYVLNIRSYKIHFPFCHSVQRMREYNKKYVYENIHDLIADGYDPCGNCKPLKNLHQFFNVNFLNISCGDRAGKTENPGKRKIFPILHPARPLQQDLRRNEAPALRFFYLALSLGSAKKIWAKHENLHDLILIYSVG